MSSAHLGDSNPDLSFDQKAALAALGRGELLQLLAKSDLGELSRQELEKVMDRYAKKHWFREFLLALLER
jgi:hypothetical protein